MSEDGDDADPGEGTDTGGDDGDPLAWETRGGGIEYTCPGFDVRRDDVTLPDGTETAFHYLTEPPSVVLLPFTPEDDVVVIEEWRQAVGRVNLGLPAGGLEGEESPVEAARRELAEETGHEAAAFERLGTFEPANGLLDSTFHYFLARGCEPTAEQALDHNESIRVGTASFADLRDRAIAGDQRDGRSALAVLQYALRTE
jgi:ADP-ribose pyrophosphatase